MTLIIEYVGFRRGMGGCEISSDRRDSGDEESIGQVGVLGGRGKEGKGVSR